MGRQDQFPPLLDQESERRQSLHNSGSIRNDHLAVLFFEGDVIIDAYEDPFPADIQIFDR